MSAAQALCPRDRFCSLIGTCEHPDVCDRLPHDENPPLADWEIALTSTGPLPLRSAPSLFRGLADDVYGRAYPVDGLHPPSLLQWMRTVEGRGPDGHPLLVCEHCGEPAPCVEEVLRHMDTDMHRTFCTPTGRCCVAGRPVSELPAR